MKQSSKKANKFILLISVIILSFINSSYAQMKTDDSNLQYIRSKEMRITGFRHYPPFGWIEEGGYKSFMTDFFKEYHKKYNFHAGFYPSKNYVNDVIDVRSGKLDVIWGMYNQTTIYNGIEYIFPSFANNPIHIITLPENTSRIKTISDARKLKGAIYAEEPLSDYIESYLKKLNIQRVENPYELFRLLFTKEIDYIIGGKYFYMIESAKLGLSKQIRFSKNAVWDMPMFVGVSKPYRHRALVVKSLKDILGDAKTKEKINNSLIQMLDNIEKQYSGVVPPTFEKTEKK